MNIQNIEIIFRLSKDTLQVVCGGSWTDSRGVTRSIRRDYDVSKDGGEDLGFRLVQEK